MILDLLRESPAALTIMVAVVTCLVAAFGLLGGLVSRGKGIWRGRAGLALLLTLACATVACGMSSHVSLPLMLVSFGCVLAIASGQTGASRLFSWVGSPSLPYAVLLAAGLGMSAWGACQLDNEQPPLDLDELDLVEPPLPKMHPVTGPAPRTDRGQPVVIQSPTEEDMSTTDATVTDQKLVRAWGSKLKLIRTGPPDLRYNCHGWVFTGGQYWLGGEQVEQILRDNGYQVVGTPSPGDVAIFRDSVGAVTHTALVRLIDADGSITLESKWGRMGRYLHPADAHSYGDNLQYYHTPRESHVIEGIKPSAPAAPLTPLLAS